MHSGINVPLCRFIKNKGIKHMWWLYVIIAVVALLAVLIYVVSNMMLNMLVKPKRADYSSRFEVESTNGNLPQGFFEKNPHEEFRVTSSHGYELYGEFYPNSVPTNKTFVIVHGHGANIMTSVKYAVMVLKMGYNALMYDNEHCGKSGGELEPMGYHERDDLGLMIEKAKEFTGPDAKIYLHGESMGSSSILMHLKDEKTKIEAAILDCPFSYLPDEFAFNAKTSFHIPRFPFIPLASLLCKIKYGFYLSEVNPLKGVKENGYEETPMLFIHGKMDTMTPYQMSVKLYEAKKGKKELYLCPYSEHARTILYERGEYYRRVSEFLGNAS